MTGPPASDTRYRLKLFVVGDTARTEFVIANFRRFCEAEFPGCHDLTIIDVIKQPEMAETDNPSLTSATRKAHFFQQHFSATR